MAFLDIARQQFVTGGSKAISESLSAAAHLRSGVTTEGGSVILDPLRIVIDTRPGGPAHEARAQLFTDHRVHLEMSTASVIVAVIGAGASPDVERFLDVLHALPDIRHRESGRVALPSPGPRAMSSREAFFSGTESRSGPGHRCDDPCPTRVGYLDGMSRSRTDKHVTQPSSFSNSEMSTRTGV